MQAKPPQFIERPRTRLFVECGYCVRRRHLIKPSSGYYPTTFPIRGWSKLPSMAKNDHLFFQTEDEGNHGNDDTRCFILSTLASQGRSKVHCVLCEERMPVFDRYPLVDGTFFLSPRQHAKGCIEVSRAPHPRIRIHAALLGVLYRWKWKDAPSFWRSSAWRASKASTDAPSSADSATRDGTDPLWSWVPCTRTTFSLPCRAAQNALR